MTYANAAWWTGKKSHERLLEKIQHCGLRLICAVFRTTPIAAMEIEASIPPIQVELNRLNRNCALRFNKLSTSNPIIQRLDDKWRAGLPPSRPPAIYYKLNRKGKKDEIRKTGAGLVAYQNNEEIFSRSIGLGVHAEAYDGEIVALSYAAGMAANLSSQNNMITHWQFFTDSASSIDTIFDTLPKP
ncbi:hypothetical protein F5879DRAFT_813279, partial [Lentinula edodes]